MFVTTFIGIANIRTGEVVFTNGGHNPPYLKRSRGPLQRLDKINGPIVGALEGMVYGEQTILLEQGDLLFMYTDGVTEAMDRDGTLFSEGRLVKLLTPKDMIDPETAVKNTVSSVKAFEKELS